LVVPDNTNKTVEQPQGDRPTSLHEELYKNHLVDIERNELEKCDFDEVIAKFATVKSRKINLIWHSTFTGTTYV